MHGIATGPVFDWQPTRPVGVAPMRPTPLGLGTRGERIGLGAIIVFFIIFCAPILFVWGACDHAVRWAADVVHDKR